MVRAATVLDLGLAGPFLEELLFRGLLQNALLLLLPNLWAVRHWLTGALRLVCAGQGLFACDCHLTSRRASPSHACLLCGDDGPALMVH